MSEISFPIKDLTRRKFQTGLTILGLTICTSATLFLVIFGSNLGFEIAFLTVGGRLTSGFSNIFSRFILVVGFLNILAGALITSFLVYLTMSERVRDIGVMKAAGCVSGSILGYFVTELSILIFLSSIAGTIFGIGAYYLSITLLISFGFSVSQFLNLWAVFLTFLLLILVSHFFGVLPILKAAKMKPAEALSPLHSLGTTFELGKAVPSKLGFTFKVAYRSLVRRKSATVQAIICLAVILTLTTVTIAGGMIANQTTSNYAQRAIGRDVVLVGNPELTERYANLLSQFFEAKEMESIDYLDSRYNISSSLVSELSNVSGVLKADPRLVLEITVYEVQGVTIDPEKPDYYVTLGDNRSGEALVCGVQPERIISKWLVFGRILNETDGYSAVIGDSLALEMFADPEKQAIRMFEKNFKITGVCLDPLNNGKVVYMPLNALSAELRQSGYNVLLLKIDPSERLQVLAKIQNEISGKNLGLLELNEILDKHSSFLNHIWSFVMFLPLFSLVTATLCLLSYLMLSIAGQQREFGIMRALGAKPKTILRIIFTQALLIILVSGTIGVSVGLFVTFVFLIPEPVVSQYVVLSVAGWLLLSLGLLCLSSLYPAKRAVKRSVVCAINSV